ncbi:MAG TPA: PaaI family thioesterase [Vicinamibacterales bacterium]|nr:PaaI family thioesterase [Vicinamibacterales bacterium]
MNDLEEHYRKLERLYIAAPTNVYYRPTISIGAGVAEIKIDVRSDFFHAAAAVHGSVYFKLLDDAGFFAANSLVNDVMLLTASFTLYLLRPVASGALTARGKVLHSGGRQFVVEAQLFDSDSQLVAHGTGTYVRSKLALDQDLSYV